MSFVTVTVTHVSNCDCIVYNCMCSHRYLKILVKSLRMSSLFISTHLKEERERERVSELVRARKRARV